LVRVAVGGKQAPQPGGVGGGGAAGRVFGAVQVGPGLWTADWLIWASPARRRCNCQTRGLGPPRRQTPEDSSRSPRFWRPKAQNRARPFLRPGFQSNFQVKGGGGGGGQRDAGQGRGGLGRRFRLFHRAKSKQVIPAAPRPLLITGGELWLTRWGGKFPLVGGADFSAQARACRTDFLDSIVGFLGEKGVDLWGISGQGVKPAGGAWRWPDGKMFAAGGGGGGGGKTPPGFAPGMGFRRCKAVTFHGGDSPGKIGGPCFFSPVFFRGPTPNTIGKNLAARAVL